MKKSILVVDDDRCMRELMSLHLREAGYEVRTAEDAIDGGRALLARAPDLLLVDINMPYMSGLEFVATLLADATVPDVPVLFVTSNADFAAYAEGLGADFLAKPLLKDQLLEAVRRNVERQPPERPAVETEEVGPRVSCKPRACEYAAAEALHGASRAT